MIPNGTDGKSWTEKNPIFILPKNFNCYICLTLRNPRQTTFHASPKSYTSNVDIFLLEMDNLYIGNNWSKTLNKLNEVLMKNIVPIAIRCLLVKKGTSHTFWDCKFTNMKPNLRLRILNSHLKLVIFIENIRDIYIRLFCCHFSLKTLNASSWNKLGWVLKIPHSFFTIWKVSHKSLYGDIFILWENGKLYWIMRRYTRTKNKISHNGPRTKVSSHIRSLLFTMSLIVIGLCL